MGTAVEWLSFMVCWSWGFKGDFEYSSDSLGEIRRLFGARGSGFFHGMIFTSAIAGRASTTSGAGEQIGKQSEGA